MNKIWQYYEFNDELVEQISNKFNINKLLAQILINKGIIEEKEIEIFLNPKRNNFYDPFLMPDMEKAINRIINAIQDKEKILIYGDYDVDGITSTTVLKKFLEERGANPEHHIPNRLKEGYGLNKHAIEEIAKNGTQLMITVDCGISAVEETEFAKSLGIETIITDHHEPGETLPNAFAIVDSKIKTSKYPFNQLAGVGVVFKLIQAISIKLGLDEREYLKYLDLVCLGTISDIVPLIDENRVIAKLGLKLVNVTKNLGLKALLISSGYKVANSNTISFGIAPRINACGRMGFANEALQLLLSDEREEVFKLVEKLNEYNKERQEKEKEIFEEAIRQIDKKEEKSPAIILGGNGWHHGVTGIVSSKITEMYFKPSILIGFEGEEGKGSGRSIPGVDLHEAILKCNSKLEKFGGHAMAIGLSMKSQNFETFKKEINGYFDKMNINKIKQIIMIDAVANLKDITLKTVQELQLLEPFGEVNRTPIFCFKNLRIDSIRALTEGRHLKINLRDDNMMISAIGFNMGDMSIEYKLGDKLNSKVWKDDVRQNYIEYTEGSNHYKMWIEDIDSLKEKLSLIKQYEIGGVASWSKDREPENIWPIIKEAL